MTRQSATRPPLLRPGDRIAIVSPASAARPERVRAGARALRSLGFEPVLMPNALASGPLYFAGTVQQRLSDLHAAFADPTLRAVLCTRGGWGTAELLPHLDPGLIAAGLKPFLGFSDHTSLHTWLEQRLGWTTFYAPMLSPDFARAQPGVLAGTNAENFESHPSAVSPETSMPGVHLPSFFAALTGTRPWSLGPETGLRLLRPALDPGASSTLSGRLWGGCLAILAEALGTPFAPLPHPGSLLFLEDVNVRPYQWDRMLLHLRYAGLFEGVEAIILGDMMQCAPAEEHALLEAAILHSLQDFAGPILIGLQAGHVDTPNVTLPLNISATLHLESPHAPELRFA